MKLLNEILGTKYPIIQGGMANIATGEFAAACSNAGALGLIGSGGMDADTLRENIRRCRALTDKPFGVNIMLMHPQADEFAKIVVEEGVKLVTTGAGNPGKYMAAWKEAGITVIPVVAAAILAKHLEPLGIDAVIAEGTESGGHVGEMTTMALVPQVVDAVHVPVIAAGGIADGRGLAAALALLACSDAIRRISTHPLWRWLLHMQIAIIPLWLLYSGTLNDLSLMKEYANRQDVFDDALAQHLTLLFGAVLPALVIGVPLGIWCYFSTARQGAIFSLLNVIQTVPSVALFGLLIAPLAALVTAFPWLGTLGIAGTGMTPALIALVLYALLPLVRGVVVGLNQIPRDVLESARAMGMSGVQRFLHVQLPLALPVFLRSLRVVMVQTVGMAVIAALIGAGGFGALVFQGLLSSAIDLVLLGVIPVIVLAVLTDALFDLLIALLKVKRND